jgi:hypothetical protein
MISSTKSCRIMQSKTSISPQKQCQVSNAGSSAKRSHSDWASEIGYANTPMEKLTISTHFSASIWIHGLKREVFCARHTLWLPINSCRRWKHKLDNTLLQC